MKAAKRFLSIIALLMAVTLLFSACNNGSSKDKKDDKANASDVADGDNADGDNTDGDNADGEDADGDSTASGKTTSKKGSKNSKSSKKSGTSASSGKTTWDKDIYGSMPDSVKKKEVHILMWRNFTKTEKALVDAYQKKTGVKVRLTMTTEHDYATKLVSLISAKDSPDVVMLSSTTFPGVAVKSLKTLDAKKFRLDDACWSKTHMDPYRINGKYMSVAIAGSWSCEDLNYVTYYNTKVLKDAGITVMPYTLYKQGKWDWAKQKEYATKIASRGKAAGLGLQTYDLFMLSAGADFCSYDGKQFTNNISSLNGNSTLIKAWTTLTDMRQAGLTAKFDFQGLPKGTAGMMSAISYGLYKDGDWFKASDVNDKSGLVEAVPMAGPSASTSYTPLAPKTWGVAKGSDNVEGAAYFLRYWLDPSNCNMASTFYTKQFKEVFDKVTAKGSKRKVVVSSGAIDYVRSWKYDTICTEIYNSSTQNVLSKVNSVKNDIDLSIKQANKGLSRIK